MYKFYQPSNLGICYCWNLFRYTSSLFQAARRLRDSRVPKIEKARTRKWEETGERKGGTNALPLFRSPAVIFSCTFYLRVIPTFWEAGIRLVKLCSWYGLFSLRAVLVKIAYSAQNSARTPLFYSNSARYPKTFSDLRAVSIFANIERSLDLTPKKYKIFIMRSKIVLHLTFDVSAFY